MDWKEFKYDCRFDPYLNLCVCSTPNIPVEIIYGNKSMKTVGLIDSGCDTTTINSEIAESLGIDLALGRTVVIKGTTGKAGGSMAKIKIKIPEMNTEFESFVIVVKDLPMPLLLGQDNFFDKFYIRFEKSKGSFYLRPALKLEFNK